MDQHVRYRLYQKPPAQNAQLSNLKSGQWLKVKCTACGHQTYISPAVLLKDLGFHPDDLLNEVGSELPCGECHTRGNSVVSIRGTVSA